MSQKEEKEKKKFEGMPLIELGFNEGEGFGSGITAISIVNSPAIKQNFVAYSDQMEPVRFETVQEEKRIIMGPVLIPNLPIYRRNEERGEFYQYMSADTIEKLAYSYLKNGRQRNTTLEHQVELNNLTMVETWLVKDTDKDKAAAFGMKFPKGTWMASIKVNDEDIWQDFIKTGKVKGFSIEGLLDEVSSRETDYNKQMKFDKSQIWKFVTLAKIEGRNELERLNKKKD